MFSCQLFLQRIRIMTTGNKVHGTRNIFLMKYVSWRIVSLQVTMNLNDSLATDCWLSPQVHSLKSQLKLLILCLVSHYIQAAKLKEFWTYWFQQILLLLLISWLAQNRKNDRPAVKIIILLIIIKSLFVKRWKYISFVTSAFDKKSRWMEHILGCCEKL